MATKKPEVGKQPTNDEELMRRQSAPKPTVADELSKMQPQGAMGDMGAMGNTTAPYQAIGVEAIRKATQTLLKYKEGKANLENRIVENAQWYKLRHWECIKGSTNEVKPSSAWLFNCITNKEADAMDNFPSPNILPREEGDQAEAEMLTSIIPVILDQNNFEATYAQVSSDKIKSGTGIYGLFWDSSKLNGLGDISVQKISLLNVFYEPGITDIQKSQNFFHLELMDNDCLVARYPQLKDKLSTATIEVAKYIYDDHVDTTTKSVVVDWYYKKPGANGKVVLHYCKYVNDQVLFSTENDPMFAERGFYDHGKYPFVFDPLFSVEGSPAGFGYIDVGKSAQEYIDRGNQAIMENMLANAKPRYLSRNGGGINEEEFMNMKKDIVHYEGTPDTIIPIQGKSLDAIYVNVLINKIDELKETTGNRDVSTGGAPTGVTAASALAALQEAGAKTSRLSNKASYRAFREVCLIIIELIRQFYDLPRCFRIMGANGMARFVTYSNSNIAPQMQGMDFGVDMGMRIPLFDIEVTAQKQSPYSKMSQNELALQFYQAGFFNPAMADQALLCLDMMDFDRKNFIIQKITENMMRYQMMMAQAMAQGAMVQGGGVDTETEDKEALGGEPGQGEATNTKKSRERVADSTSPT